MATPIQIAPDGRRYAVVRRAADIPDVLIRAANTGITSILIERRAWAGYAVFRLAYSQEHRDDVWWVDTVMGFLGYSSCAAAAAAANRHLLSSQPFDLSSCGAAGSG